MLCFPKPISSSFFPDKKQVALRVKPKQSLAIDVSHRDAAIKHGSDAAMILTYKGQLTADGAKSQNFAELETLFDFEENDILVATFADSLKTAESAAWAVAYAIHPNLPKP